MIFKSKKFHVCRQQNKDSYEVIGRALTVGRTTQVSEEDEKLVVNCADCRKAIITTVAKHQALVNRINDSKPPGSERQTSIAYR